MSEDEHRESRRDVARRNRREIGDRSSRLARVIMKMSDSALARLRLDDDLGSEVDRARKVASPIARRRAERSLAGSLRAADLDELESRLANVKAGGDAETRLFKSAERWRERLIDEATVAADVPGGNSAELASLIREARRERDTGRPRGAARALFRHLFAEIKAQEQSEQPDSAGE